MSTKLYDDQLVAKLKEWSYKTKIQVYGPDETRRLFEVIADETGDKPIKLPIICLSRGGGYEIINMNKKPLTYDGITKDATVVKSLQINAIPISIPYQLDVYTRYYEEADSYMRDIIFNVINHPTFEVVMPYNDANLVQMGVGPIEGFHISGATETWDEFLQDRLDLEPVKTYVYLKVKMYFDPPQNSAYIEAINKQLHELEVRLYTAVGGY